VTVPASALAQAIRRPERQARLARLIRQPTTDVVDLGRVDATNVGRLLAASGTTDVVDAHVVVCARRAHQRVATSDPDDSDAWIRASKFSPSDPATHPVPLVARREGASERP
jgi:hypothetical protein